MSRLRKLAARRLRVLYGAQKPLPHPGGKYGVAPTYEEQLHDFEVAARRARDRDWRGQRAAAAAGRIIHRKSF